jgi:hydrogenase maturation protease
MDRTVVLGLGNILSTDEGAGVAALDLVRAALTRSPAIEVLDGGTLGLSLLPIVEDCSHLLILDAVQAGQAPGTVVELARDEIPLYSGVKLSEHQVSFQEVLGLAAMRGKLPPNLHLIGVQPESLAPGVGLTPTVQSTLPTLAARALAVLALWGLHDAGGSEKP